jgi:hypothetical protein
MINLLQIAIDNYYRYIWVNKLWKNIFIKRLDIHLKYLYYQFPIYSCLLSSADSKAYRKMERLRDLPRF